MGINNRTGAREMNELSETRLWKTLDTISDRLTGIEKSLAEVVRLEERMNNHDQILNRHSSRIENHDRRIHEAELWQASYGDKSSVERMITNVQEEVSGLKDKINEIESSRSLSKGHQDIIKDIVKWIAGIAAAYFAFKITSGD